MKLLSFPHPRCSDRSFSSVSSENVVHLALEAKGCPGGPEHTPCPAVRYGCYHPSSATATEFLRETSSSLFATHIQLPWEYIRTQEDADLPSLRNSGRDSFVTSANPL